MLKEEDIKEIHLSATKRLEDFGDYLATMASKRANFQRKEDAKNSAVALFFDNKRIIQVSSKKRKKITTYLVPDYFQRIMALQYDQVEVQWSEIAISKKLIEGHDGFYYGTAYIVQHFTGKIDDLTSYTDTTRKVIEIRVEKLISGDREVWDVRLGNVTVAETK